MKFGSGKENGHMSKKIHLLILQFYLKFQEDTEKDYVKNSTLLDFHPILQQLRGEEFNASNCKHFSTHFSTTGKP